MVNLRFLRLVHFVLSFFIQDRFSLLYIVGLRTLLEEVDIQQLSGSATASTVDGTRY